MTVFELDIFRAIWVGDTEFQVVGANHRIPVCLCAMELCTGRRVEMFFDQPGQVSPFPAGEDSLFIAYAAAAEHGTFLQLGWPLPRKVIDLYFEHLLFINGVPDKQHAGLLNALQLYGIDGMEMEAKDAERDYVILNGITPPPGVTMERHQRRICDYCWLDINATTELFLAMLQDINLDQALLRGDYSRSLAYFEVNGVPVNVDLYRAIESKREDLKLEIARKTEAENKYGVYSIRENKHGKQPVFSHKAFDGMIDEAGLADWPRTAHGAYKSDKDTLKDMSKLHPELEPLRQAKGTLDMLSRFGAAIGDDGLNRYAVFPFATATGRNAPKASENLLLRPNWVRGLIQPRPGWAVIAVDICGAETGIAAALSGDPAMFRNYFSDSPYMTFAIEAGAAPKGATKKTHVVIYMLYKTAYLGINYGMSGKGLAIRIGVKEWEADIILAQHHKVYAVYWDWLEAELDAAMTTGHIETMFGWGMRVVKNANPRAIMNFQLQAGCAEILRISCSLLEERGYGPRMIAPLHDAVYFHAPLDEAAAIVASAGECFAEAGQLMWGDALRLRSDAKVIVRADIPVNDEIRLKLQLGGGDDADDLVKTTLVEDKGEPLWNIVTAYLDREAA